MSKRDEILAAWQRKLQEVARSEGRADPLPLFGPDGLGGGETRGAILAFQKDHGLDLSGQLDEATRAALNPPKHRSTVGQTLESIGMFTNIVKIVLGLLPGLPDDVNKIRAVLEELASDASDHNGIEGLRDAARFARIIADEADKVANALDPSGTIQPSNPILNK